MCHLFNIKCVLYYQLPHLCMQSWNSFRTCPVVVFWENSKKIACAKQEFLQDFDFYKLSQSRRYFLLSTAKQLLPFPTDLMCLLLISWRLPHKRSILATPVCQISGAMWLPVSSGLYLYACKDESYKNLVLFLLDSFVTEFSQNSALHTWCSQSQLSSDLDL